MTLRERFETKWREADSGCWEWTANSHSFGYGMIRRRRRDGSWTSVGAHRVSWELHNGQIPEGMSVLHRCDNPACVNPDHLFLGTHADNMADKAAKGRGSFRGARNPRARFVPDDVRAIRNRHADGESIRGLARSYGCSQCAIQGIVHRRTWRHIE